MSLAGTTSTDIAAAGENALAGALVRAKVMHRRTRPRENRFTYGVFFLCLPLSRLDELPRRFLALDGFGLVSFHRRDHGPRDGSPLLPWIRSLLAREGLAEACDGEVVLHCHPRVLGYVFNPVSFWYCHDRAGALRAVLCEVSNTFGERHCYLVAHDDGRTIAPDDWLAARKVFHVSPFMPVTGHYRFRFRLDATAAVADIRYYDGTGEPDAPPALITRSTGRREGLTSARLLRACLDHPLMTVGVIGRIHWQALKIWLKGARFYSKPEPPADEVTR